MKTREQIAEDFVKKKLELDGVEWVYEPGNKPPVGILRIVVGQDWEEFKLMDSEAQVMSTNDKALKEKAVKIFCKVNYPNSFISDVQVCFLTNQDVKPQIVKVNNVYGQNHSKNSLSIIVVGEDWEGFLEDNKAIQCPHNDPSHDSGGIGDNMNIEQIVKKYCTVGSNKRHVEFVNNCIVAFVPDSDMEPRHEGVAIIVGANWEGFAQKPEFVVPKELKGTIFENYINYQKKLSETGRSLLEALKDAPAYAAPIQLQHKLPENIITGCPTFINGELVQQELYNAVVELQNIVSTFVDREALEKLIEEKNK